MVFIVFIWFLAFFSKNVFVFCLFWRRDRRSASLAVCEFCFRGATEQYRRTSVRGMAPPDEYAWYLLCSSEDPQWRRIPEAANWFELSIMTCHGQRLGTRKNSVSFYFVFQGFAPMPPKRYPMHSVMSHIIFEPKVKRIEFLFLCHVLCFLTRRMEPEQYAYAQPLTFPSRL